MFSILVKNLNLVFQETVIESLNVLVMIAHLTLFTMNVATENPWSVNDVRRDFTEDMAEEIAVSAFNASFQTGIPAEELIAIAWRESRFRLNVVGDNGRSCGPMQIRWDIWSRESAWSTVDFDATGISCYDLKDWDFAMMVSAYILLINRNQCSETEYLAAYNGGCRRIHLNATQNYQNRIRSIARRIENIEEPVLRKTRFL
jgi:hypothetical protein